jgi:hypothetical protein
MEKKSLESSLIYIPGFMTWYHGTINDHAEDIIHHGINWNKGLPMMDFSNGKGFYLQDNLVSAIAWSKLQAEAEERFRLQQAERRVERLKSDLTSDDVRTKENAEERLQRAESRQDRLKKEPGVSSAVLIYRIKEKELATMNWKKDQPIFDGSKPDEWRSVVDFYR